MRILNTLTLLTVSSTVAFSQYAPPADEEGTTAIANDSSIIVNWANSVVDVERGLQDISNPDGPLASYGMASEALGYAEGTSGDVISLGDGGSVTLGFQYPIKNEEGWDFAVFENSFSDGYLELAHVEVSSDGDRFVRIPSISLVSTEMQTGPFAETIAQKINNLAGKYRQGYGTPFDLEDIADSTDIDLNAIRFVRIIDVVGSIDPLYGSMDSEGNMINDPYATNFESGGFDLDAIAVIHEDNPFTGLNEFDKMALQVYPNPTNGIVRITGIQPSDEVTLFNLQGNFIATLFNVQSVNLNDYGIEMGVYMVAVTANDGTKKVRRISYIH